MKIYLYFKVDRGFYESAYTRWKQNGGDFNTHLLRTQQTIYTWKHELEKLGHTIQVDLRSSFILPQEKRAYLPLALGQWLRAGLWLTQFDPWLLQRDIVERIKTWKPDIVFIPLGSAIWEDTLITLKRQGFKLVQWCGLPAKTMLARDRANLKYFDLTFTPANLESGLRQAGLQGTLHYIPIGIDPTLHYPRTLTAQELERLGSDVCFIGGLSSQFHQSRRAMIEYALRQGISMKIWGGRREHFIHSPILQTWQGAIWGEEQVKALCAAKIGLNFHVDHQPGELDQGLNMRAFELPACQVFQLLQRVPSVSQFFEEGRDIVCFETCEEMVDKIHYYLRHPEQRQQIAKAGYNRVVRAHTWQTRVKQMAFEMQKL